MQATVNPLDAVRSLYDQLTDFRSYDETADQFPYTLPENALTFDNISDVKRRVTASGSHFFDHDGIRFFNARTIPAMYGRRFWIESARYADDPRHYRIAWVADYEGHLSIERSRHYASLPTARSLARTLAHHVLQAVAAAEHAETSDDA